MKNDTAVNPINNSRPLGRAGQLWLAFVQSLVLSLTALGFYWARSADYPQVDVTHRALLAVLGLLLLVLLIVPRWRRSELTMVICSLLLAISCWMSHAARLINTENWHGEWSQDFAMLLPYILGVALLTAISGLLLHGGILGESRLGRGALLAGAFFMLTSLAFFLLITRFPSMKSAVLNYDFPKVHLQELFAAALLYCSALWLGGVAIRREGKQIFLPFGQLAVVIYFLIIWQVR